MSPLEALMLICFGAAWPFSILRSYRSQSTNGKSVIFLLVIILGYLFGIAHKLLYDFDLVVFLYIFNVAMVSTDTMLWFRNKRLENAEAKEGFLKKLNTTKWMVVGGFLLLVICGGFGIFTNLPKT